MSYDLAVYAPRALSQEELRALVRATSGLDATEEVPGSLTVVRGARRRYCCSVTGPDRVEEEDVPVDVVASVLGPRFLYSVAVEGSSASEVPHAERLARRLAETLGGAVVDQQADRVWSRSRSREIRRPGREARVETVDLDWYCLRDDVTDDPARLLLGAAERALPEALPRRFGEYEPLQGSLRDSGRDGFSAAWNDATGALFFSGSGPSLGGRLGPGPRDPFPDRFWSMSVSFFAEPFQEEGWREHLRRFFVALADRLPAFYATAAVTRGHIWTGRSLWSDAGTEAGSHPLRAREGWLGLPPEPTWWSWLGGPYRSAAERLPARGRTSTAAGTLYEAAPRPAPSDALEGMRAWLPPGLFATPLPSPGRELPRPLARAADIPRALA